MLSRIFTPIFEFVQNGLRAVFNFLANLFGYLFQKLIDFLKMLLMPVFVLIAIIFYFLYKIAEIVYLLITVLLGLGKVFVSLVKGIFTTLSGFTMYSAPRADSGWSDVFANVMGGLQHFQLDTIAYILLFLVWFITAFAAIRIIQSMRGGGE